MQVNLKKIEGNWDSGYVLDKHVLKSVYLGDNENGRPQFDTERSEAGEALFQMKYRNDKNQIAPIAMQIANSVIPLLKNVGLIIPMPASNVRAWQPVTELAKELGLVAKIPVFENILGKAAGAANAQLKDMNTKEDKIQALAGRFTINDEITNEGRWNALLVDDLFDTGASMEAACGMLRTYAKIDRLYVAAISWK